MDLTLAIPAESHSLPLSAAASSSVHSTPAMVGGSPLVSSSSENVQAKSSSSSTSFVGSLSLSSLLQCFFSPEKLDGDNQYHCNGPCNGLQDGERHVEICAAPAYLVITLMRFSYDAQSGAHSKIFTDIQYPLMLSIPVRSVALEPATDGFDEEKYGLVGVIVHSGSSSDAGHYFCYARHSLPPSSTTSFGSTDVDVDDDCFVDHWFTFNDSRVMRASFDSIRSLTHKFSRDTAYVLIFRRVGIAADAYTDASVSNGFALDPPLHRYLCDIVDEDNQLYLQVISNNKALFLSSSFIPCVKLLGFPCISGSCLFYLDIIMVKFKGFYLSRTHFSTVGMNDTCFTPCSADIIVLWQVLIFIPTEGTILS